MNKSDLISRVSILAGLSKREATEAVDAMVRAIQGAVARGERVTLPGFGTFGRRQRAARTARNPRSGQALRVPPTLVPSFKPGRAFKEAVSGRPSRGARASTAKSR